MAHVRVLAGDTVSDGQGGYVAAGAVLDLPDAVAEALVRNGHAEGAAEFYLAGDEEDALNEELEGGDVGEPAAPEQPVSRNARRRK